MKINIKIFVIFLMLISSSLFAKDYSNLKVLDLSDLTEEEIHVIVDKGTERPYSGKYYNHKEAGTYTCKVCSAPLYESDSKFDSHCGWPSFDDEIKGAVRRKMDADGRRIEILCARCGAHLGHVFKGEGFTPKNIRHCVNSISLNFQPKDSVNKDSVEKKDNIQKAYFAGGCFWGVEYHFEKLDGVKSVVSGYMGGHVKNPSYRQVVRKNTGHLEVVEVTYDANKVNYEALAKLFFEIHDSTQKNGQGPDIGPLYLSAVFTSDEQEKKTINKLFDILRSKGYDVATKIYEKVPFYKAESYHQDYYEKTGKFPYCHSYKKIF